MSDLITPVTTMFRFNSEMLSLVLADLDPEDFGRRWKEGSGSSIAFLTGHLISSRYGLLRTLGAVDQNPFKAVYGAGVGSKDAAEYRSVDELKATWDETAELLHGALEGLSDEDVLAVGDGSFPIPDHTLRGNLTFIMWHESYHVGQIGIMRTEMGYPSIRQTLYAARAGDSD